MAGAKWEFWIDVGGTFTDCLAKALDGSLRRYKLLSSGVTKGRVGAGSSVDWLIDPARRNDPSDFWTGWQLAIVGDDGRELDRATVKAFDSQAGRLKLPGPKATLPPNASYELRCELDAPVIAI